MQNSYKKDPDYFMSADKLTITEQKSSSDDWKNPILRFGFQGYNPSITVSFNKTEPIGRDGWKNNNVNLVLDFNTFLIWIESVEEIISRKEYPSAFSLQITGTKQVEGIYIQGETELKGIITFGLGNTGIAFIMVESQKGLKKRFRFRSPFRGKFSEKGEPFDDGLLSQRYALGTIKHWSGVGEHIHVMYMKNKNLIKVEKEKNR